MGPGPRAEAALTARRAIARAGARCAIVAAAVAATPAAADPILSLPPVGRGELTAYEDGAFGLGLIGDVNILAVVGAGLNTEYPEVGALTGGEPVLASGRVGLRWATRGRTLQGLVRIDLSEGLRTDGDDVLDEPVATASAFLDDAVVTWTPRVWASLWLGRHKVPFSRFRHFDRQALIAGAVPFGVDRVAPDRRWGASFTGDLGALSYAVGGFADLDVLERRAQALPGPEQPPVDDPSGRGRALVAGHVEWTPRAPIRAHDDDRAGTAQLATPRDDPWYDTARVSAGVGVAWRYRDPERGARLDGALHGMLKYRRYAAAVELIASVEGEDIGLVAAGQASAFLIDRAVAFADGSYDSALEIWSAGAGITWFATRDRRSAISFVGWVRRSARDDFSRDGAIVRLQASL